MNLFNIRLITRQLKRKKYYTLVNIFGLGIGLGCTMLMAIYLIHEFSFDRYHSKAQVLYRVIRGNTCGTPYAMGDVFKREVPEVKDLFRIYSLNGVQIMHGNEPIEEKNMVLSDPSILTMMDIKIINGNRDELLTQKNKIIISEALAQKYFPGQNPVGKSLKIKIMSNDVLYNITGVFQNFPSYSSLQTGLIANIEYTFDFLFDIEKSLGFPKEKASLNHNDWERNEFMTFVELNSSANKNVAEKKCTNIYIKHSKEKSEGEIHLQPFTDIYLHSGELHNNNVFKINQLGSLKIFMAIGLLILLVGCINFILISNADIDSSMTEIACRKVNGASSGQIIYISLFKTCLVAFLGLILALVFLDFTIPVFNNLFQHDLSLLLLLKAPYLVTIFTITLLTGIVAGIYLGFYASGVSPVKLLQNKIKTGRSNSKLKGSMVIVQFVAFILLITCFMFMQKQYDFSLKKDLGLNSRNIVVVSFSNEEIKRNSEVIRNKLAAAPQVVSCVLTSFMTPPTDNVVNVDFHDRSTDKTIKMEGLVFGVGELELLHIPVKGQSFNETNAKDRNNIIINEAAAKELNVNVGDHLSNLPVKIIGIVPNFHFHSLHQPVSPLVILPVTTDFTDMLIKTNGNPDAVIKRMKEICSNITPGFNFDYELLDNRIVNFYEKEEKQIGIIAFFSAIALALSIMGLLGFVSINLGKRTKEIGIRKINGAKFGEIVQMFYLQYIQWIIVAFLIASPIAWYAMNKWLQNFAYKTGLSWWVFATAGILAVAVVLITISWQSWRSATRNPVEALRYE